MENELSIYRYLDYRRYLLDFYAWKKTQMPRWSYGVWARQLGLRSGSTLMMLVNGQRNPGAELVDKMVAYLKLDPSEAGYFSDLVRLAKAERDPELTSRLMDSLVAQREAKRVRYLDPSTFHRISRWYTFAIREMANLPDFKPDALWICSRLNFKVTPEEVCESLRALLAVGLMVRDAKGKLRPGQGDFDTPPDLADDHIKRFHEDSLENAKRSLRRIRVEEREFYSHTLALPASRLAHAKRLIRKFQSNFTALLEQCPADSVYQLQIAFYPLVSPRSAE